MKKIIRLQKRKIYYIRVNVEAARYFFANLQNNKNAKEYFLNRGIKEETIKRFGLGYAYDSWNGLNLSFKKKRILRMNLLLEAD